MSKISPFSLRNEWSVKWKKPGHYSENTLFWDVGEREMRAMQSIYEIGVIKRSQLIECFFGGKKNMKIYRKMVAGGRILEHELIQKKETVIDGNPVKKDEITTICTIGPMGTKIMDKPYEEVWNNYEIKDIMQRLIFFRLYGRFIKKERFSVEKAPSPFVGSIRRENGPRFLVGVIRDNIGEWLYHLRWQENADERILMISENLRELTPINEYLKNLSVRVSTDADLRFELDELFYIWRNDEWIKAN